MRRIRPGSAGSGELAARTDLVTRLDRAIAAVRPFKVRRRGRSGGELLVALAELMVVGGDHLLHLDELREDEAGAELNTVLEAFLVDSDRPPASPRRLSPPPDARSSRPRHATHDLLRQPRTLITDSRLSLGDL